jgi:hypothetical protein
MANEESTDGYTNRLETADKRISEYKDRNFLFRMTKSEKQRK